MSNHYTVNWLIFITITIFAAFIVYKGYRVIKLRPSHTVGLLPENVLSVDFNLNSGFTKEEKEKLFYYNAIKTYSTKIAEGTDDTSKRAGNYDVFLRLTLSLILIITIFLLITISSHPVSVRS